MDQNNSIYENVVVRVCCQHGKPCTKGKQERLMERKQSSSDVGRVLPEPRPGRIQASEEMTYENLDPVKPTAPKELPSRKTEEEASQEGTSTDDSQSKERKRKKKRDRAVNFYLGTLEWRRAEERLQDRDVALYHQAEDPQTQLFLLTKRNAGLRHYRIIQRNLETGTVFMAEDGTATPLECGTLDSLIKYYKAQARK